VRGRVDLPAVCFNQYNVPVLPSPSHSSDADFARTISRKFAHGGFLIVGSNSQQVERQFAEAKREALVVWASGDLAIKLGQDEAAAHFETAVWFYPSGENDDDRMVEALSHCAANIVLIPGPGTDAATRRPQLVQCFARFGLLPDYGRDLIELDPAAVCLRRQASEAAAAVVPEVETAFAKLNRHFGVLRRALSTCTSELEAAHRHIATVEERLLKLKQYQRELKFLKEQKEALRKSAERKLGQILLAPYRLPQKLIREIHKRRAGDGRSLRRDAPVSEYEKWLHKNRVTPEQLQIMRKESHWFTSQPLISILTPVLNTPVSWLWEAVESAVAQAYENWEIILIDDGSTAAELLRALPTLATRDGRIRLVRLENHQGISAALNRGLDLAAGEWITFLDHDDVLEPDALLQSVRLLQENPGADLIYSDEDKLTDQGFDSPILKPDWSPDFFLSCNYLCHMIFLRRNLVREVGGFRPEFDGSQDYDLLLRIIERTNSIHHIPRVLYHWRRSESSSASNVRQKPGQLEASWRAIEDHLKRRGEPAHVAVDWRTHAFCVRRELLEPKKISVIIPSSRGPKSLERCIESITRKTSYPNYEIVIVQGGEKTAGGAAVFSLFPHRLLHFSGAANLSAPKNYAIEQTDSPWILFLDDSIEVIDPEWLAIMAEHVQRPEVGAVGARLMNPNGIIEHAGLVLGVNGIVQPAFRGLPAEHPGVNRQLQMVRNCSAVSGACLLMRREVFQEIGRFDETLSGVLADVDLCLKIRRAGYLIVYTPLAKLSCEALVYDTVDASCEAIMRQRWSEALERDPYYNPNLSRERADFSLDNSTKIVHERSRQ
jgi:O-antigen biosynthesis protein